jgi:hypothetical protein
VPGRTARTPGRPGETEPGTTDERSPPMQTAKLAARYARYLLTNLAAVAFALSAN